MPTTVDDLRRFAVAQSLFPPTTLKRALDRLGFVQADPIRAPARAQDLMLRHRVKNYRTGDLEQRYCKLGIEEDVFINYGFVTRSLQALMHPRSERSVPAGGGQPWPSARKKKAQLLLDFVSERGAVHPREVDNHFSHGSVKNYWGGSSNATTHLLEGGHTNAELNEPIAVAVDGLRNLYIADAYNNAIRKVAATGIITTVAGNGTRGYSGDGGPATSAEFAFPNSVAVDGVGNLYIADDGNNVIRKVAAATGIVTTVAGNGTAGYSGDGGPATSAEFTNPGGVAVDGAGNLYIEDGVIRKVTAATGIVTTVAGDGTQFYSGDGGIATFAQFALNDPIASLLAVDGVVSRHPI